MTQTAENANTTRLATFGGFGAILLWSATVAVVRSLSEQVGTVTAAAGFYCVSGIIAITIAFCSKGKWQRILSLPRRYLIGCGLLFAGYALLLCLAIGWAGTREQVIVVGLLNYAWPVLTLLFSLVLLNRIANWPLLPGTLMAVAGIFLVLTHGSSISRDAFSQDTIVPYSFAFGGAILWALYSNLAKRWADEKEDGGISIFLPATGVLLLLISFFFDEPRAWNPKAVAEALFMGGATYFAYMLWDNAMRLGNFTNVTAASYLTPLFSTLISVFYLAVLPGSSLWIGCCILIAGSLLSWRSVKERILTRRRED